MSVSGQSSGAIVLPAVGCAHAGSDSLDDGHPASDSTAVPAIRIRRSE
ncbi:hypothetical protein [Actinoplanes regularis]|nr:hypothetical protein [Actinoplanes regularis]